MLRREPAVIAGVINAAILCASVFLFHWDPEQIAAIQGLAIAVTALLVRQTVVPVATVAEKATQVGTKVAEQLDSTTVGTVGAVTGGAKAIINDVVNETLGGI